ADNVCDLGSRSVVSIQGERAAVVLPVWTQGDLLKQSNRAGRVADSTWRIGSIVGKPRKVIQLVLVLAGRFPNAHAEVPILRRACGVHELRSVAMPRG